MELLPRDRWAPEAGSAVGAGAAKCGQAARLLAALDIAAGLSEVDAGCAHPGRGADRDDDHDGGLPIPIGMTVTVDFALQ